MDMQWYVDFQFYYEHCGLLKIFRFMKICIFTYVLFAVIIQYSDIRFRYLIIFVSLRFNRYKLSDDFVICLYVC